MSKKNLKKFAAVALAATMAFGSTMVAFAEGEGDASTTPTEEKGVAEGNGSYEGGEIKYPTLSVTLPTIPAGTYDYIADPNGLIAATSNEKYANAVFNGNTGIFFKTGKDASDATKDSYTEKSAAQEVTNENAQDIDVTVKLEQKTAGDAIIKYAESATFGADDKENKLYLAVTDDAATDPNVAALTDKGAAIVKTTVPGVEANYEPKYVEGTGYTYALKTSGLADWQKCSFILTGAINMNEDVKWGDNVTFPTIKVTWSYKEHTDAYVSETIVSTSNKVLTLSMPDEVTISKVELTLNGGNPITLSRGNQYTVSGTTLTFGSYASSWVGGTITITYSDNHSDVITCQ